MLSDYELIKSRDMDMIKMRYGNYIRRLAMSFANAKPDLVYELTEKTYSLIAATPFAGPFAYQGSHPTVRMWISRQLVLAWSLILKHQRSPLPAEEITCSSIVPTRTSNEEFEMDTDTTRVLK